MDIVNQAKGTVSFFKKSFVLQKGCKLKLWQGIIIMLVLSVAVRYLLPILLIDGNPLLADEYNQLITLWDRSMSLFFSWLIVLAILSVQSLLFCGLIETARIVIRGERVTNKVVLLHLNKQSFCKVWLALIFLSTVVFSVSYYIPMEYVQQASESLIFLSQIIVMIILTESNLGGVKGLLSAIKSLGKNITYLLVYFVGAMLLSLVSLVGLFIPLIWFVPVFFLTLAQIIIKITEEGESIPNKSGLPSEGDKDS